MPVCSEIALADIAAEGMLYLLGEQELVGRGRGNRPMSNCPQTIKPDLRAPQERERGLAQREGGQGDLNERFRQQGRGIGK